MSPRTALDYRFRLSIFQKFCSMSKLSVQAPADMDAALVVFLEQCFCDGMSINEATKFLAAIIDHRPELAPKNILAHARRALKGWKNLDPGTSRPPVAWPVVALIVSKMLELSLITPALLVLTMFVTYCRPFELLQLQAVDLVKSQALGPQWSLILNKSENMEKSKVGMQDESMLLDSKAVPWLGQALALRRAKHPSLLLFDMNYQDLRAAWKRALASANLPSDFMVPYQLRRSGASWDRIMQYRAQLEVKCRGRWASDNSMLQYEKRAMVIQLFEKMPPAVQRNAKMAALHLKDLTMAACHR